MDLIQQAVSGFLAVVVLVEIIQAILQLLVLVVLVQQLELLMLVLVTDLLHQEMDLPQEKTPDLVEEVGEVELGPQQKLGVETVVPESSSSLILHKTTRNSNK